jgi:hypothetical protein
MKDGGGGGATRLFVPAWHINLQQRFECGPHRPTVGGHLAGREAEAKAGRTHVLQARATSHTSKEP